MSEAKLHEIFEIYPKEPRATVPIGMRVNDMVYASGVAGVDSVSGQPAGDLKAQMEAALDQLARLMEQAGGSLDNLVRAVGYVSRPEDREPIYDPWDERFPDPADRPAFKALVAPLPPGHLVHLDAVGLIGARRRRIDIPNVPARDPTVVAANWMFTSRCHGHDSAGEIVAGGLGPETRQNLENLVTLTKIAGGSETDLKQVTMFGHDESYLEPARRVFEERFSNPSTRPVLHELINVVTARFAVAIEGISVLPDAGGQSPRGEEFEELYLCPDRCSAPAGVRLGPMLFAAGLTAADPCSGRIEAQGLEAQLRSAFANMDRLLAVAGCGREHVARVTVFMSDLAERHLLNVVWSELYPNPNERPPHKYVRALLPDGVLASIQVLAIYGASRRVLEVPGLVHQDPMSMGGLTGNLITSSRVFAGRRVDDPDEHTQMVFESVQTLLRQAGGGVESLSQVTAFVGDSKYRQNLETVWRQVFGSGANRPRLHVLETDLGGNGAPRLEILGLI
jgi:2-iminobutanoate/2-iminopropanoate deaminase